MHEPREERRNGGNGLRRNTDRTSFTERAVTIAIAALIGTGGGFTVVKTNEHARADPYTGQDGEYRANIVDAKLDAARLACGSHEERIVILEGEMVSRLGDMHELVDSVHRIELQIAKLPPIKWQERIRQLEIQVYSHEQHFVGAKNGREKK